MHYIIIINPSKGISKKEKQKPFDSKCNSPWWESQDQKLISVWFRLVHNTKASRLAPHRRNQCLAHVRQNAYKKLDK
jgi:hypothetical protein